MSDLYNCTIPPTLPVLGSGSQGGEAGWECLRLDCWASRRLGFLSMCPASSAHPSRSLGAPGWPLVLGEGSPGVLPVAAAASPHRERERAVFNPSYEPPHPPSTFSQPFPALSQHLSSAGGSCRLELGLPAPIPSALVTLLGLNIDGLLLVTHQEGFFSLLELLQVLHTP